MTEPITTDLYDHSHEEEEDTPPPRLYRGLIFCFLFEAIAAASIGIAYCAYHLIMEASHFFHNLFSLIGGR